MTPTAFNYFKIVSTGPGFSQYVFKLGKIRTIGLRMLSLVPTWHLFRRLVKLPRRVIKDLATRTWQIAPSETTTLPLAFFLPGQLERVTAYEFASDDYYREMYGGREINHAPTMGYLIEQALLVNGVLYKKDASTFLATHRSRVPPVVINREIERGALYATPGGIRYFGQ